MTAIDEVVILGWSPLTYVPTTTPATYWITSKFRIKTFSARGPRYVDETELRLLAALIMIDIERAGEVERLIAITHQDIAQGRIGGAEGDGLEARAIF